MTNQDESYTNLTTVLDLFEAKEQRYLKLLYSKYFLVWGTIFILYSWIPVAIYYSIHGWITYVLYPAESIALTILGLIMTKSIFKPIVRFNQFRIKIIRRAIPLNTWGFIVPFYLTFFILGSLISYFSLTNKTGLYSLFTYLALDVMLLIIDYYIIKGIIISYSRLPIEGYLSGFSFGISVGISILSAILFQKDYSLIFTIISISWTVTGIFWIFSSLLSYRAYGGSTDG